MVDAINAKLRQQLFDRGAKGIRGLTRAFTMADDNGNRALDIDEFGEALNYAGLFLSAQDTNLIYSYYDRDSDGNVSVTEFLAGLQGQMNDRRTRIVEKAFGIIDKDGSGCLDVNDIAGIYNVDNHPQVLKGEITKEEALEQFLDGFDGAAGNNDGSVTMTEFKSYYGDLSASVPSDEYFVQMMESVWMMKEDDTPEDEEDLKQLETILREKVRQKCTATADERTQVRKVFKFFDEDEGGYVTIDEFNAAMERFGIPLRRNQTMSFFNRYDKDGSGTISYDEFIAKLYPE
jgi:Ca2+-binding EF-hand superfamily protein